MILRIRDYVFPSLKLKDPYPSKYMDLFETVLKSNFFCFCFVKINKLFENYLFDFSKKLF